MLCSKCKRKVKIDWGYFVEIEGKTKKYLKKMNLCNPCHQIDCKKARNDLRDNFNAMFTINGVDRDLVKTAMSSREI
jgi:hypothetical protein|tara:strand:- start:326 stop:556 length:231 start_codon:yes stop_codon:yes gene_type:complete